MNMHLKAETDIPRLKIRSIKVELRSGDIATLHWNRSRLLHAGKYLMGDCFLVYSDIGYAVRHPEDLKGMKVLDVEMDIKSPSGGSFEIRELTFYEDEDWTSFGECYRAERPNCFHKHLMAVA